MPANLAPFQDSFNKYQAPELKPVFSVLVAGHRQQRLQPCDLNAEEINQRQEAIKGCMKELFTRLRQAAGEAFNAAHEIYADSPPRYRLITGSATGADALAAHFAEPCGYELDYLLPRAGQQAVDAPEIAKGVSIQMQPQEGASDLSEEDYCLRDRLALSFNDLLIAVWDGEEPKGLKSGTALMIREALLRRTPVCIIYLPKDQLKPRLLWLDWQRLTDAWMTEVKVLGCTADLLLQVFEDLPLDAPVTQQRLQQWMDLLLVPFKPALQTSHPEITLLKRIERQRSVSRYFLQWLFWWAHKWGWRKKTSERPLSFWEWVRGSWLWLQIMLKPPQKSEPIRLMEILQTQMDGYSRQERFINRAHGFFSNLAKLDLGSAIKALFQPPCYEGYKNLSGEGLTDAPNPIKEPALANVFEWSDTQAREFSTRYRDDTWLIYYAAAFAVFCAVAGAIHLWPAPATGVPFIWVFLEFILLHFIVRRVLQSRFRNYHGRWMSFRYVAEQVRYLRLGYPLLVLPPSFAEPIWEPVVEKGRRELRLKSAETWILQRVLIAEGLPRSASGQAIYNMTEHNPEVLQYIRAMLEEHRHYYYCNYHHLHREHTYLHRLAFILFALTFVAVTVHFFSTLSVILIFTAFFPAWGAAIHGILSQNEVVRVSSMSAQVWQDLTTLKEAFELHEHLAARASNDWQRTQELRKLVDAATDILADANHYWRSLFQHNHPNLPA